MDSKSTKRQAAAKADKVPAAKPTKEEQRRRERKEVLSDGKLWSGIAASHWKEIRGVIARLTPDTPPSPGGVVAFLPSRCVGICGYGYEDWGWRRRTVSWKVAGMKLIESFESVRIS
jgi:hypothetical protein